MKKYSLITFVLSVTVTIGSWIIAEACFRFSELHEKIIQQDMFCSRLQYFRKLDFDPDIIAIGNSRVRHGLDTRLLDTVLSEHLHKKIRSWNFGMGGVTAQTFLPLSLRILERKHKPLLVVFGVAPADFVNSTPKALKHLVFSRPWQPTDIYLAIVAGANANQAMDILLNSSNELLKFRPIILDVFLRGRKLGPALGQDIFGYKPEQPVSLQIQRLRATNRARGYRMELVGKNKSTGHFKLGCFRVAIRSLVRAGIKVVVVQMPESSEVRHIRTEPDSSVDEIFRKVKKVCKQSQGVFVDKSTAGLLDDHYFTDGDHLNFNGAKMFTMFLLDEVLIPIIE